MHRLDSGMPDADDQTWLIDAGHLLIEKKRAEGLDALTPRERLILCFWTADYSMRNAGDLTAARDLYPAWLVEARAAAATLDLPRTTAAFGLSEGEFERRYFELFETLCGELRGR